MPVLQAARYKTEKVAKFRHPHGEVVHRTRQHDLAQFLGGKDEPLPREVIDKLLRLDAGDPRAAARSPAGRGDLQRPVRQAGRGRRARASPAHGPPTRQSNLEAAAQCRGGKSGSGSV